MLTVLWIFSSHPPVDWLAYPQGCMHLALGSSSVFLPNTFLSLQLLSQVCLPCCYHPFGRGFHGLIATVWQTHPSSGLWAWPRCWWPGFTVLAGAVTSQYLTVLPRPRVILQSSGKCPFRSSWVTSFQMSSHNIFTLTSIDGVPHVKGFCAIHCPGFGSSLPSLGCRSQSCIGLHLWTHHGHGTLISSVPSILTAFLYDSFWPLVTSELIFFWKCLFKQDLSSARQQSA